MDISDIINGKLESDEEKQYFIPFIQCGDKDFLDNVIRKLSGGGGGSSSGVPKEPKEQGLWICLKLLHGDQRQVTEENPHLVSSYTAVARKMGFPEVILPGDVRNDLYLTLVQGDFSKGTKSLDRSIEVTVMVCNEKGFIIPGVITYGAGADLMDEYKSVIYYHEDKPKWMETFKIAIPIEEFYSAHLKFTFKHRSSSEAKDKVEKPFALSYVKLMQENGTTLKDETHELLVYKVRNTTWLNLTVLDHKRLEDPLAYLNLPATRQELEELVAVTASPKSSVQAPGIALSPRDAFSISSLVCSTKLTQNVDLLGLLKWRTNPENLEAKLYALMKVDGEEVVKDDASHKMFNFFLELFIFGKMTWKWLS
ncbi:DOCK2 [Cordylochernes scorpioides]|uniref:DOCK2 n=1 Tax=Cordylochernes scorpioides TaxID=51811 RepID=A0ABY6KIR4_9ARAC|nr:DOCK2 [Cordylochernes scorpioides]